MPPAFLRTSATTASLVLALSFAPSLIEATQATELQTPNCTPDTPDQCLNGVSAGVTGGASLRTIVDQVTAAGREEREEEQQQALGRTFYRGKAAGEMVSGWGVWASGGYTHFLGDPVFGTNVTRFDGDLYNGLLGADMTIGERVILGAALGYEHTDTDTDFNGGEVKTHGFTLAPYVLFIVNDYLSIDVAGGYSWLDNKQSRINPASTPGAPVFLGASFDSDRWFASANLNGTYTVGKWLFGAQLGVLKTEENQDGYNEGTRPKARTVTDRRLSLSQGHVSIDAAYGLGSWEPYARAGYYTDFSRDDGQGVGGLPGHDVRTQFDDDAWRFAGGIRYFGSSVSGGLEVETEQGRKRSTSTSVLMSIRADF